MRAQAQPKTKSQRKNEGKIEKIKRNKNACTDSVMIINFRHVVQSSPFVCVRVVVMKPCSMCWMSQCWCALYLCHKDLVICVHFVLSHDMNWKVGTNVHKLKWNTDKNTHDGWIEHVLSKMCRFICIFSNCHRHLNEVNTENDTCNSNWKCSAHFD